MKEQPEAQSIVSVVDDDASLRDALSSLLRSVGLRVEVFGSAADFLKGRLPDAVSCLVLDIRLPGVSGLDFQAELAKAGIHIPIIFITGHGDIPMTVRAMKAGAVEFLEHFSIRLGVARVCEISSAFVFGNLFEKGGDGAPQLFDSACLNFA
jgi:FixJ family two-component response regulator